MRFAGIDAGTKTYDIFWFDDSFDSFSLENLEFELEDGYNSRYGCITISSFKVKKNPELLVKALEEINADFYAGLSGYGLPIKHFSQISDTEFKLMTLSFEKESALGLRKILKILSKSDFEIYTIPAVIHLRTVPAYRKFCRIDMGTYDKLCTAVLSTLKSRNHIVVEAGYGYNAFLAVSDGKIVDGIGGTSGFPSYGSVGCMDAELAYLLGNAGEFRKNLINCGFNTFKNNTWKTGIAENILKGIKCMEVSLGSNFNKLVYLSGRIFKEEKFFEIKEIVTHALEEMGYRWEVIDVNPSTSTSAIGAAIVACGVGGGKYKKFLKNFGVFDATGSVIDYLPEKIKEIIKKLLIC